jgi:hypothetical protein
MLAVEVGADSMTLNSIESLGEISCLEGRFERAVQLFSGAVMARMSTGAASQFVNRTECERLLELARSHLSAEQYHVSWHDGSTLDLEDVVEYALENDGEVYRRASEYAC